MAEAPAPTLLKANPGIKRDGTIFDGDFYTDGQWVRFQRGLPRKIGGYRSVVKKLTEISRGFTNYVQQGLVYCHSGSANLLQRFSLDSAKNSSIIGDRTPLNVAAVGSVTLISGSSGQITDLTVNGVTIISAHVSFNTSLAITATDLASNITAFVSSPNYTAVAVGTTVNITSVATGSSVNGFGVAATQSGTLVTTTTNMVGGITGLTASDQNRWMFDYAYDPSALTTQIFGHASPNGTCICNDVGGQIFYGDVTGTARLVDAPLPAGANATGGIVMLHPYLFYYGTGGIIGWSVPGTPTDLSGSGSGVARVWGQKIIKGLPLRAGAGSAPAGLFWAYDAVIRASFTGGATSFQFDTIATDTSIMSADSVVDYDGIFFWAGVDRFLMFNGVVREVPNQMNMNWFFDGLNTTQRSKVFAYKVPRFGEIWWCYPRDDATECTHAVIYNARENSWYDTALPSNKRASGGHCNAYAAPILTGGVEAGEYPVWIHEQGVDEIDGQNIWPIESYFETCDLSAIASKGANVKLRLTQIEPDFVQSGDMYVQVTGRANARSPEVLSRVFTFPESASEPYEQIVVLKEQRRELRVKFGSNVVGGDYQMGQIVGLISTGDHSSLG